MPGDFEFPCDRAGAQREGRLIVKQWRELSRKHGEHGRPFSMTIVRDERGYISVFGGYPAGRVKDE